MSKMVSTMEYFNCVSTEDYVTSSFTTMDIQQLKQHVLLARHHRLHPAERKFGIAQKNIQRWLKNFSENDFEQVSVNK